jgi:hypothetical protein
MTERKSVRRVRRVGGGGPMPDRVRDYFAGTSDADPWEALIPGDWPLLLGWWLQWERGHPGASPPDYCRWLASPHRDGGPHHVREMESKR